MSINKFHNQYRIESIRARWHNYDSGAYFVTICTENREHFFGEIEEVDGCYRMILSEIGKCACATIEEAPMHNLYAEIPTYIVMPNHIHMIAIVETVHAPSLHAPVHNRWKNGVVDERMQMISQRKNKLSFLVGNIKSNITRVANQKGIAFSWQTRFYDHIIRNPDELNRIAIYIENNVSQWGMDHFNG